MPTRWLTPATFLAISFFCASAESEQNLLKNPGFDDNISSWRHVEDQPSAPGMMTWSSLDAGGSSKSGSLELRASATSGRETFAVGQCVGLMKPAEYAVFGGKIRVPAGQPVAGIANLHVEHYPSSNCSGEGLIQSGLGGIANADFWSIRTDFAGIHGAGSVRLIVSVTKRYEWKEGDQTGEIDDHVLFHAFFDDLFLQLTKEAGLAQLSRRLSSGSPQGMSAGRATGSWGKNTVQAPTLSVKALGENGRQRAERTVDFSSLELIRVEVSLQIPYTFDEPQWYPVQGLSVAARSADQGFMRRPTLEFFLYRIGDSSRRPLEVALDSGGGGVFMGAPQISVAIGLTGKSEYRVAVLRAFYDCLKRSLPQTRAHGVAEPTDDQLLSGPLMQYFVANPPGDYELVVRYLAMEAGFWHDPVYSEPLRIRIVKKDFECGNPRHPVEKSPPDQELRTNSF